MPHTIHASFEKTTEATEKCPLCNLYHPHLIHRFNQRLEADVIATIQQLHPNWETWKGICSRCYDEFEAMTCYQYRGMEQPIEEFKLKFLDYYVLPIPERLNADSNFTGKGVTICFIDSGFYLHPDFKKRVIKTVDVTSANEDPLFNEPVSNAWHGTMTTAVSAGDGTLSRGLYRGLAKDASLVLIKTQNESGKITDESIIKALQWVLDHHVEFDIRIVNLSLSGDLNESLNVSKINQLAETLFHENVLVVAAVGNQVNNSVLPPASSPHVVAVGGLDDQNKLDGDILLYHSTYGITIDGFSKPDLISNAIWIPAPILPFTKAKQRAEVLFLCLENEEYALAIIQNHIDLFEEEKSVLLDENEDLISVIKKIVLRDKLITPQYMHVDGTSFAAPIVSSVAAQMIEACASISAFELRKILLQTASPLQGYDIARQGHGRLQPKLAVYSVMEKKPISFHEDNPIINKQTKRAIFYIQFPHVKKSISLVSSFNNWKPNEIILRPSTNDTWYVDLPMLPNGRHEYKFFIDDSYWLEDISNPWRVVDNHGGWNNVFEISEY